MPAFLFWNHSLLEELMIQLLQVGIKKDLGLNIYLNIKGKNVIVYTIRKECVFVCTIKI